MTDEEVDRKFMEALRKELTPEQIEALAMAPKSYFERLAPYCVAHARELGVQDRALPKQSR